MKYLCLVYHDEAEVDALSQSEYNSAVDGAAEYAQELSSAGRCLASATLGSAGSVATIRLLKGKLWVIDGPVAETKEQLVSFLFVEARDLNDAIRMASRIPSLRLGCIEVRPVKEWK